VIGILTPGVGTPRDNFSFIHLDYGTCDNYVWADGGERLWPIMPAFDRDDVPALITLAEDTDLSVLFEMKNK
jgi:hypothetical protein